MGFWGLGIKHDVKQWIPGINELLFSLSFAGGYSKLTSQLEFDSNGQEPTSDSAGIMYVISERETKSKMGTIMFKT